MMNIFKLLTSISFLQARISLENIENVSQHQVVHNNTEYVVNPTGPLNMLRGYLYMKERILYNKRVYSSEILTNYKVQFSGEDNITVELPNHKDDPVVPRSSTDFSKDDYNYISSFTKAMIHMFTVECKDVSIVNNDDDSFYRFLTSADNIEYAPRILAALLLVSEGVEVPLRIQTIDEVEHLVLATEKDNFQIPLPAKQHNENEGVVHYDARTVLEFFTKEAANWRRKYHTPEVESEFEEGYFTRDPNFLLQSYICELPDHSMLMSIVDECHGLLTACMEDAMFRKSSAFPVPKSSGEDEDDECELFAKKVKLETEEDDLLDEKRLSEYREIYDRWFTEYTTGYIDKYCFLAVRILDTISGSSGFPFFIFNEMPGPVYVSQLRRIPGGGTEADRFEELKDAKPYKNDCEMAIYCILCNCFYNPDTKRYTTEHIPNASDGLKSFFSVYSNPFDIRYNKEFYRKWSEVLADINVRDIGYELSYNTGDDQVARNKLKAGWINMMMVIIQIIDLDARMKDLSYSYSNFATWSQKNLVTFEQMCEFLNILLGELSVHKVYEIKYIDFITTDQSDRSDIYGKIQFDFFSRYQKSKKVVIFNDEDTTKVYFSELGYFPPERLMEVKQELDYDDFLISSLVFNMLDIIWASNSANRKFNFKENYKRSIDEVCKDIDYSLRNFDDLCSMLSVCYKSISDFVFIILECNSDKIDYYRYDDENRLLVENSLKAIYQFSSNLIANEDLHEIYTFEPLMCYVYTYVNWTENFPCISVEEGRWMLSFFQLPVDDPFFELLISFSDKDLYVDFKKFDTELVNRFEPLKVDEEFLIKRFKSFDLKLEDEYDTQDAMLRNASKVIRSVVEKRNFEVRSFEWLEILKNKDYYNEYGNIEFLFDLYDFEQFFTDIGNLGYRVKNSNTIFTKIFNAMHDFSEDLIAKVGFDTFIEKIILCASTKNDFLCLYNLISENYKHISHKVLLERMLLVWKMKPRGRLITSASIQRAGVSYLNYYKSFYRKLQENFAKGPDGKLALKTPGDISDLIFRRFSYDNFEQRLFYVEEE